MINRNLSQNSTHLRALAAAALGAGSLFVGCMKGPGFLKQSGEGKFLHSNNETVVETRESEGGVVTATVSSNSQLTQLVNASSSATISGTQVAIPPGALSLDTEISVEEGSAIASSLLVAELGIQSATTVAPASPAVVVTSSVAMDTSVPFTLSLPLSGMQLQLALADPFERLIVVYRIHRASDNSTLSGIFPRGEISIEGGKVYFQTRFFGSYQAALTDKVITEKVEAAPTEAPILSKVEEKKIPDAKLVNIAGSHDPATRHTMFSVSLEGSGVALASCSVYSDINKIAPWDYRSLVSGASSAAASADVPPLSPEEVVIFGRFECADNFGRILTSDWSSAIAVAAEPPAVGPAAQIGLEDAADGSGSVIGNLDLIAGATVTLYAIARDAQGLFVENIAAGWTVDRDAGTFSASSGKQTVFTARKVVSGSKISAAVNGLTSGISGNINISAGAATALKIAAFTIGSGNPAYTGSISMNLYLADATGVADYRKADGTDCSAAVWNSYTPPIAHTLPTGDGNKTVCIEVRDAVGNASASATDTITLDRTNPSVNAGPDQVISSLPYNFAAIASDGSPMTYQWTKTSGPGTVTYSGSSDTTEDAIISALGVGGIYVFRLSVTDAALNSYFDEVQLTYDITAPTPGGGSGSALWFGQIHSSSVIVNWYLASDGVAPSTNLEYAVYRSAANNIGTVSDAEINGTPVGGYQFDVSSRMASSLSSSTSYYFAVIVRDPSGNKSIYSVNSVQTRMTPGTQMWFMAHSAVTANQPDQFNACAVDPVSGDVYVTGFSYSGGSKQWTIKKYQPDGFEIVSGWNVAIDQYANANDDIGRAVVIDSSRNVYVAGMSVDNVLTKNWYLRKFNPDGTIGSGTWPVSFPPNGEPQGVTLDSAGDLYAAGYRTDPTFGPQWYIKKFLPSGTIVSTGWNKQFDFTSGNYNDQATSIAYDSSSGRIVVAGFSNDASDQSWWLKNYDTGGVEDTTYWNKSLSSTLAPNASDFANGTAADGAGKVYVVGTGLDLVAGGTGLDWRIKKYTISNGAEDWQQIYHSGASQNDTATSVALDNANGYLYVGGGSQNDNMGLMKRYLASSGAEGLPFNWPGATPSKIQGICVDPNSGDVYAIGSVTNQISGTSGMDAQIVKYAGGM